MYSRPSSANPRLLPVPLHPLSDSLPPHQGIQPSHRAAATVSFPRPRTALMPVASLHLSLTYAAQSMATWHSSAAPPPGHDPLATEETPFLLPVEEYRERLSTPAYAVFRVLFQQVAEPRQAGPQGHP